MLVCRRYVSKLTGELAFDGSSPAVRLAVMQGLALLVDNPHAQPVLKVSSAQVVRCAEPLQGQFSWIDMSHLTPLLDLNYP